MKHTILTIQARKGSSSKIVMVTAYDATFAGLLENAGVDVLLVGDSVGMVVQGHDNTIPVTLDDMVYHTRAVARGSHRALIVADLPFMTYKESIAQAMQSAARLMQDGRAHAVKLEGGQELANSVHALVAAGIPVMGHIGLTPQSVHALGGFKVQGRKQEAAAILREDAIALEEAGCFALVLEGIPASLAAQITRSINIPTIGIGAGPHCDGQVLVCYDLLGLNPHFKPKFLKQYAQLHENVSDAVKNYCEEVRAGIFPASEHSFDEPWAAICDDDLPEGIRYAGSH